MTIKQGTDEWLTARRSLITATDIPVLLGLSPYKCEADLADEKAGAVQDEPSLRMRVGSHLQDFIGEVYAETTGHHIKGVHTMYTHKFRPWAAASPDFKVARPKMLVEAKHTSSRTRFADGLPQDVEAQVMWQLGVTGYERADVAVLTGDDLLIFPVQFDHELFADLIQIAEDFRRRLAAGGPFARDSARIKRDHPSDDGSEMEADAELAAAVTALVNLRAQRKDIAAAEERIEDAIKARMGDAAILRGDGFRITWKQTKPIERTDWKSVADGLLRTIPEPEAQALVGIATSITPGTRPFRVTSEKE